MAQFKVAEASEKLNVSRNRVYQLIKGREIGFHLEGKEYRISQKQIDNYLKRNEVFPQSISKKAEELLQIFLKGGIQMTRPGKKNQGESKYWNFGIGNVFVKGKQRLKDKSGKKYPSYYIRYYDESGNRQTIKAKGAFTKKQASLILLEEVAKIGSKRENPVEENHDISLREFWEEKREKLGIQENERKAYDYSITKFFNPDILLSQITVRKVDDYVIWMKERENAPKTICERLKTLRKILNDAKERSYNLYNGENPVRKSQFPKVLKNGKKEILSLEEEKRLLSYCEPHIKPIVITAIESGMRLNEVLNLTWDEVKEKGIRLPVQRTKDRDERFIPFSLFPGMHKVIIELRKQSQQIKDSEFENKEDKKYVFLYQKPLKNGRKKWIHPTTIKRSFTNSIEKAGLEGKITFHSFRHTMITREIIRDRIPTMALNKITGHNCFKMTEHYTHFSDKALCQMGESGTQIGTGKENQIPKISEIPSLYGVN